MRFLQLTLKIFADSSISWSRTWPPCALKLVVTRLLGYGSGTNSIGVNVSSLVVIRAALFSRACRQIWRARASRGPPLCVWVSAFRAVHVSRTVYDGFMGTAHSV